MGVPVVITDMSTTAASNSPAGSDSIGTSLDDYIRSHAAFIAQLFSTISLYAGTVGGTANAITLTPSPALTAYATGQRVVFKATGNSSGSVTLAVSGLSAKNAYQSDGTTQIGNGDIVSGKYYAFIYDSTLNSAAGGYLYDASGNYLTSATAASTYAPLASPTFTGTPTLPTGTTGVTQAVTDSSTKLATTAFTKTLPTIQKFTSGSGTYTTQSGALWLKIRIVAGGGGGGAAGTGGSAGNNGGDTNFGSWTAIHGNGGACATPAAGGSGGTGGVNSTGTLLARFSGGKGSGSVTSADAGAAGGVSIFGGGGAAFPTIPANGDSAQANTGSGGGGATIGGGTQIVGAGGGAGEYVEFIITSPSATYSYAVGAGGAGGTGGSQTGGAGAAGIIIVEEYYIG